MLNNVVGYWAYIPLNIILGLYSPKYRGGGAYIWNEASIIFRGF
jgi:hypothetical protein